MRRAEQNNRLVIAAGQGVLFADNQEPRNVIGNIFNILAQ